MSPLISAEELARLPNAIVLDARFRLQDPAAAERLFGEAHIPGAQRVDLDKDLSGAKTGKNGRHPLPSKEALRALFSRLGIGAEARVVAYDDADHAGAARLWMLLRWMGLENVQVLNGGLRAWKEAGFSLESGEGRVRDRTEFGEGASFVETRSAPELGGLALYDARAKERYLGQTEPIDPKAGHIPGAQNLPYATLLGADGKFLGKEELRARLPAEENPVFYCGSGVSACVLLLACAVVEKRAGIYPGSWSEWCAIPNAPVEMG